jgi:hypothetical protein
MPWPVIDVVLRWVGYSIPSGGWGDQVKPSFSTDMEVLMFLDFFDVYAYPLKKIVC